jgi:alpha-L-arabinofuranosidase
MAHMYHWKNTVGDIDARTPLYNIWGYNATHGLGFHEYLQMTEDLGSTPLFCINGGMSHREVIPMDQMGQWVQDARPSNTPTARRTLGRLAREAATRPFNLRYMEIGNENGTRLYNERWALMYRAIKNKHPEMQLVANL